MMVDQSNLTTSMSKNLSYNSTHDIIIPKDLLDLKITETVIYCIVFLVSIFGNSFIVWTVYKDNRLKTTTNYLVTNMAVSDLLYTLVRTPSQVVALNTRHRWLIDGDVGLALCKLVPFIRSCSIVVSMYTCVFVAIDRYYAVAHPMRSGFCRYRLKLIIPLIWVFSILLASPNLYFVQLHIIQEDIALCIFSDMHLVKIYFNVYLTFVVGLAIPSVTLLYILIVCKLRQHRVPGQQRDSTRRKRDKQNRKVLKMSIVIISTLYFTWVFYGTYVLMYIQGHLQHLSTKSFENLAFIAIFATQISFCYNFFIYLIFNNIYRENFKKTMLKCCYTQARQVLSTAGRNDQGRSYDFQETQSSGTV